jgi:oligopeptide transport system permease protein
MLIAPAAFLAVTVLAVIALGDTLRAALDPRRR